MSAPIITIHFDGDFDLTVEDVFPDGAPDPLTVEDVVEAVQTAGTIGGLIADWGLAPSVSVTLSQPLANGRQHYNREVRL